MNRVDINRVLDVCKTHFVANHFEVPARGRVFTKLAPDVLGWVGLNLSSSGEELEILPNVGVHHVPLMKIVFDLSKRRYVLGDVATYARALGELMPGVASFKFFADQDPGLEAKRLVDAVVAWGLPWMLNVCSLDALVPMLREREEMLGGVPERVAVALRLQGKKQELISYLKDRQAAYDQDLVNPHIAAAWKLFSGRLMESGVTE